MTLKEAKQELKAAYIKGEGYPEDQNFYVCYDNGECICTNETEKPLPMKGIIGIQFCGSDGHYAVGYELFHGERVIIEE